MVPEFPTIAEAARLIEKRELSPVELLESRLERRRPGLQRARCVKEQPGRC